jgi:replicative DNA helicase
LSKPQDQPMPASVDAEIAILGSIILNNDLYFDAAAGLTIFDFSLDSHRRIYRAMIEVAEDGAGIDIVTLNNQLSKTKEVEAVGGVAYLSSLTEGLPRRENIDHYLEIVRNKARLREMILTCQACIGRALDQSEDVNEIVADVQKKLFEVLADDRRDQGVKLSAALDKLFIQMTEARKIEAGRTAVGLRTGLNELDVMTSGYHLGETTVIAAHTSDGKTSMLIQAVIANLLDKIPCQIFSLEMPVEEIAARVLAAVTLTKPAAIRDARLVENMFEWDALKKAKSNMSEWPLYIDESSDMDIDQMISRARLRARKDGCKLYGWDFVQLIKVLGAMNNADQVSTAMRRIRDFSKAERVHSLVLSQLTLAGDKKKRRPTKFDLRQSADLANFANNVISPFRPVEENNPTQFLKKCEILVLKQRAGVTGVIEAEYDLETLLFKAIKQEHRDS